MTLKNIDEYLNNEKKIPEAEWDNVEIKNMYKDELNYTNDDYKSLNKSPFNEEYKNNYNKIKDYLNNSKEHKNRYFLKHVEKDMIENIADLKNIEKSKIESDILLRKKINNRQERVKDYNDYIKIYEDTSLENINEAKKDYEKIMHETEKRKRNLVLNTFYEKKYKHQTYILKELTFLFLLLLTLCMFYKFGLLSDTYFVVLTGLGMTIAGFLFLYRIYTIVITDKTDYDSYDPNIFLTIDDYVNKGDGIIEVKGLNNTIDLELQDDLLSSDCVGNLGSSVEESVNNVVNKYKTESKINKL